MSLPDAGRVERAKQRLADWPRSDLGHYPTRLEALPRLAAQRGLGGGLWVKRDDCSGLGLGGNKVRKLEFLMGEAREKGADVVLTTGALQSNHARQTAAAAARLGLRCELVLPRLVESPGPAYETSGNRLLDDLFGARVFEVDDVALAARTIAARLEAAQDRGETLYPIPPGGSSLTGCIGFVAGAVELAEQALASGLEPERIGVAVSTGGTLAGLLAGLALVGWDVPVLGACVYQDESATAAEVERLLAALAEPLGIDPGACRSSLRDDFLGPGYGIPTAEGQEMLREAARLEGLLLDPVYTAKGLAALCAASRESGGPVLFWHTGGAPALFAYPDAAKPAPG